VLSTPPDKKKATILPPIEAVHLDCSSFSCGVNVSPNLVINVTLFYFDDLLLQAREEDLSLSSENDRSFSRANSAASIVFDLFPLHTPAVRISANGSPSKYTSRTDLDNVYRTQTCCRCRASSIRNSMRTICTASSLGQGSRSVPGGSFSCRLGR
jgi:hypothetical protein